MELPQVIILAGGRGTRLTSVLADRPKPMALVGGRPFLSYLLDALEKAGFTEVTLSVGYLAECIAGYFGTRHGTLTLRYVEETSALGTGGAIARAIAGQGAQPFLVINGDTFFDIDYRAFIACWRRRPQYMAIALTSLGDSSRYGRVVVRDGQVAGFTEKRSGAPGVVNAGLYLLTEEQLRPYAMPQQYALEKDLLEVHCASLAPSAFESAGYFIDIGVPEDLERARQYLPSRLGAA